VGKDLRRGGAVIFDGLTSGWGGGGGGRPKMTSERIDGRSPKIRLGVRRTPPKALMLTS